MSLFSEFPSETGVGQNHSKNSFWGHSAKNYNRPVNKELNKEWIVKNSFWGHQCQQ